MMADMQSNVSQKYGQAKDIAGRKWAPVGNYIDSRLQAERIAADKQWMADKYGQVKDIAGRKMANYIDSRRENYAKVEAMGTKQFAARQQAVVDAAEQAKETAEQDAALAAAAARQAAAIDAAVAATATRQAALEKAQRHEEGFNHDIIKNAEIAAEARHHPAIDVAPSFSFIDDDGMEKLFHPPSTPEVKMRANF